MKLEELRARLRMHRKTKKSAPKPRKRPDGKSTHCIRATCGRDMTSLVSQRTCEACVGFYMCELCSKVLDVEAGDKVLSSIDAVGEDPNTDLASALCKRCFAKVRKVP